MILALVQATALLLAIAIGSGTVLKIWEANRYVKNYMLGFAMLLCAGAGTSVFMWAFFKTILPLLWRIHYGVS